MFKKTVVVLTSVTVTALAAPASAMGATVLMVGGITTPVLPDLLMEMALDGQFTGVDPVSNTPWTRVNVPWPAQVAPFYGVVSLGDSVAIGTDRLRTAILTTAGPKTVLGVSAGSLVVDEVMRELADDPGAPPKTELTFIVIADGSQPLQPSDDPLMNLTRTLSGYTYKAPAETQYNLIVVTSEYDGFADWPDRWWNVAASANAAAGILVRHSDTFLTDLDSVPDEDITVETNSRGGVTTSYFVRAEHLPLVTLFPALAPMEAALKQQVDAGYRRNDAVSEGSDASPLRTAADAKAPASAIDSITDVLSQPLEQAASRARLLVDAVDDLSSASQRSTNVLAKALKTVTDTATDAIAVSAAGATDTTDAPPVRTSSWIGKQPSSTRVSEPVGSRLSKGLGALRRTFTGGVPGAHEAGRVRTRVGDSPSGPQKVRKADHAATARDGNRADRKSSEAGPSRKHSGRKAKDH